MASGVAAPPTFSFASCIALGRGLPHPSQRGSRTRLSAANVARHRRVELLAWFNGNAPGGTFDLATKPRSRAAYRALITPLGR
jgi:hypothetical protein